MKNTVATLENNVVNQKETIRDIHDTSTRIGELVENITPMQQETKANLIEVAQTLKNFNMAYDDSLYTFGLWNKTHGVAEYMYVRAAGFGLDSIKMYVLGILHSIGTIEQQNQIDKGYLGAELLINMFGETPEVLHYADILQYQHYTPDEYVEETGCTYEDIPKELILLWEALFHVDGTGLDIGYEDKLEQIGKIYGIESEEYNICKTTIEWLVHNEDKYRC